MKNYLIAGLLLSTSLLVAETTNPVSKTYTLNTVETIKPYKASYVVKKMGMKAVINTSISFENGRFVYTKNTKPKGMAKMFLREANEVSIFSQVDGQLKAHQYTYTMQGKDQDRNENFQVDDYTKEIVGTSRGTEFSLPVEEQLLDRASMEIALMLDAGKRQDLNYRVIDRGRIKDYKMVYKGQQQVKAAGEKYTCDMYKVSRSSGKRSTSLCLAEELGFLPVMAIHDENGTELKMMLTKQNLQ